MKIMNFSKHFNENKNQYQQVDEIIEIRKM